MISGHRGHATRRIGDTNQYLFPQRAPALSYRVVSTVAALMTDQLSTVACRAARAILRWSAKDLCRAAGVSATTVSRLEAGDGIGPEPTARITSAFAKAGVELLGDGRPGARRSDAVP